MQNSLVAKYPIVLFIILFLISTIRAQERQQQIAGKSFPIGQTMVHDPVMIKQDSVYYIFCSGYGIRVLSSTDMKTWKVEKPVFAKPPKWATEAIPEYKGHTWAPDISYFNGQYYLYYSVSAFGKNTSCIGVATNKTLHPNDSNYQWIDHGKVIPSIPGVTNWNAIDGNLILNDNCHPYLAFGSFWNGLKLVKLTADGFKTDDDISNLPTIASRLSQPTPHAENPIEAPFIFKKDGYYYLFASIDYCCLGVNSSYKMIIGRSENIEGPYLDKEQKRLDQGGGSILLQGDDHWSGVGHNGIATIDGADYIIYHAYDKTDNGKPKLIIKQLRWIEGWPEVVIKAIP
jgi:arabinan endo-1,5-alpha-L-arabinosidase